MRLPYWSKRFFVGLGKKGYLCGVEFLKTFFSMNFKGTIILRREEDWFVATCLENDIASQGKTIDEATENLKEAIALYYEDESEEKLMFRKEQIYITSLEMAI